MYRSLSHEILREYREYERTSTTVLNAYVGPRVNRYLEDLERLLESFRFSGRLLIMQSNGGTMSPATAKRVPVSDDGIGSGRRDHRRGRSRHAISAYPNVIAFDMGGTTAKVSLVQNGEPDIAQGYFIGGIASGHPGHAAGRRHHRSRRRRRQHRLDRRGRRAQGRPAQRGRPSGTRLLRPRRHRADRHRCERRARPRRRRALSRRRDAARRRGGAREHPREDRRAARNDGRTKPRSAS